MENSTKIQNISLQFEEALFEEDYEKMLQLLEQDPSFINRSFSGITAVALAAMDGQKAYLLKMMAFQPSLRTREIAILSTTSETIRELLYKDDLLTLKTQLYPNIAENESVEEQIFLALHENNEIQIGKIFQQHPEYVNIPLFYHNIQGSIEKITLIEKAAYEGKLFLVFLLLQHNPKQSVLESCQKLASTTTILQQIHLHLQKRNDLFPHSGSTFLSRGLRYLRTYI